MANPRFYDPKLFPQQAARQQQELQQQQTQQLPPPSPASGFHLLSGLGELAIAAGHFFSSGGGDTDEDEAEAPRRVRPRVFGARPTKRVGQGACCKRGTQR